MVAIGRSVWVQESAVLVFGDSLAFIFSTILSKTPFATA